MANRKKLIVPSSINILTMVNESILQNRKKGFEGQVELPSLRRRAKLIVNETGLIPVSTEEEQDEIFFTR